MTHNLASQDFSVAQTTDPQYVGEYNVVITSTYNQLNLDKSVTQVSETISFRITVTPCIVTTYAVTSAPIEDFVYTLDDPTQTIGPYAF